MKSKPSKQGLCAPGLALMLAAVSGHAADQGYPLRVVSSQLVAADKGVSVTTRISRSLTNSLLAPRQLRIALLAADGSVRDEKRRFVGPAQLARHSARDVYLVTALDVAPQAQDRLQVEWLASSR
jgi:hypothetical protein